MVFSNTTFLFIFLPAVFFFYWLPDIYSKIKQIILGIKNESVGGKEEEEKLDKSKVLVGVGCRKYKNLVLLFFSILFYAWGEPTFVLVLILSIIANYSFGRLIDKYRNKDKFLLWLSIVFNLGILFIFKYLCFTLKNIGWLINKDFSGIKIILPLGISFFTFQAISYVIDVYRKKVDIQKNLFNLGLYISLFPQLIAGPIVRYETIAKEIETRNENFDDFAEGTVRFVQGLAKKVIIANQVALVADAAFETPINELSTAFAWLGAIAYTLQIYFDFSGYSDMAIGLGRMFGFHFLENFNYPYMASSITDFWRKWHISLSSWFRDFVYFPLGGSRVNSKTRHIFNLFIVWLLTGLWHGANWTFVAWGLLYFFLLVIEKHIGLDKKKIWWGHIYTMFFVILAWVLFRADSIKSAYHYIKIMFIPNSASLDCFWLYWSNYRIYLILGIILSISWSSLRHSPSLAEKTNITKQQSYLLSDLIEILCFIALFFIVVCYTIRSGYNPFIYFNF